MAVRNRGQQVVLQAMIRARSLLPFPLRGIDSDNGAEFLTTHVLCKCQKEQIIFTRCRPFKKNGLAHVEQKNWSVVRHLVGSDRYEGQTACYALQER